MPTTKKLEKPTRARKSQDLQAEAQPLNETPEPKVREIEVHPAYGFRKIKHPSRSEKLRSFMA